MVKVPGKQRAPGHLQHVCDFLGGLAARLSRAASSRDPRCSARRIRDCCRQGRENKSTGRHRAARSRPRSRAPELPRHAAAQEAPPTRTISRDARLENQQHLVSAAIKYVPAGNCSEGLQSKNVAIEVLDCRKIASIKNRLSGAGGVFSSGPFALACSRVGSPCVS